MLDNAGFQSAFALKAHFHMTYLICIFLYFSPSKHAGGVILPICLGSKIRKILIIFENPISLNIHILFNTYTGILLADRQHGPF